MEAKRFEDVVVLIADGKLDSNGETINIEDVVISATPIPVNLNFDSGRSVGTATLKKSGEKVLASLNIMKDIEENLVPCVGGRVNSIEKGFSIESIGLAEKNADSRIPPLRDSNGS